MHFSKLFLTLFFALATPHCRTVSSSSAKPTPATPKPQNPPEKPQGEERPAFDPDNCILQPADLKVTCFTSSKTLLGDGSSAAQAVVKRMEDGTTYKEGCPVAIAELAYISLSYVDLDDDFVYQGELIIQQDHADKIIQVFKKLFLARFPIARMQLASDFLGNDDASMQANNTSAFNCRKVAGTSKWSQHAYGNVIDLNPLINPYVNGRTVSPPGGREYLDRKKPIRGLITSDSVVVKAFNAIGWGWGGNWTSLKDYQHFSSNGK